MRHYIHRMRQKSELARKQIAFTVSAILVVLIGGVWAATLPVRLDAVRNSKPENQAAVITSPLDSLKENFNDGVNAIRGKANSAAAYDAMPGEPPSLSDQSDGVIISEPGY
jgi:hypothetical protein